MQNSNQIPRIPFPQRLLTSYRWGVGWCCMGLCLAGLIEAGLGQAPVVNATPPAMATASANEPPKVTPPKPTPTLVAVFPVDLPAGKVLFRLHSGLKVANAWPDALGAESGRWWAPGMATPRLVQDYTPLAIRKDRPVPVHLLAFSKVTLPAGEHRFLLRSRGGARLWLGGKLVATTPFQKFRGDGHQAVEAIPEPPAAGGRAKRFGDGETVASFSTKGSTEAPEATHELVLEALVGSSKWRPETGEMLAAVQLHGQGDFLVLDDSGLKIPVTDAALVPYFSGLEANLDQQETAARRERIAATTGPWQARHAQAAGWAQAHAVAVPTPHGQASTEIDRFLISSWEKASQPSDTKARPSDQLNFTDHIRPILDQHCLRCHGAKAKGGLNLESRENLLKGGESGSASVIPGQPQRSHLLSLLKSTDPEVQMPPKGDRLSAAEQDLLTKWVQQGAAYESAAVAVSLPPLVDDTTFLRRTYLHLLGVPPQRAAVVEFQQSQAPHKRTHLVETLLQDAQFADHWVSYWQDVLAENPNILKPEMNNSGPFRFWIHEAIRDGKSMDRFVTELVLMQGSAERGGTAGFAMASQNDVPMAEKANILAGAFLGAEMKCARCHDAPYHEAKQEQLFQLAALLAEKPLKVPPSSSVPAAFFEKNKGREARIKATLATGAEVSAAWPFRHLSGEPPATDGTTPLQGRALAAWELTHPQNVQFARVMVNRVWKRLMGQGLVEAVHDWEGRKASHPELLEWLALDFMAHGYDLRHVVKRICLTDAWNRTGQPRSMASQPAFLAPQQRRYSAEQVVDTLRCLCGHGLEPEAITFDHDGSQNPNYFLNLGEIRKSWQFASLANERDRQALALPKAQAFYDVLEAFGWRSNRPDSVSERPQESTPLQPAILANGVLTHSLVRLSESNPLTEMACAAPDVDLLSKQLWLHLLGRMPTAAELENTTTVLAEGFADRLTGASKEAEQTPADPDLTYRRISWTNHLVSEASEIKMRLEKAVRQGPQASLRLKEGWRERAEDVIWSLVNHPEFLQIP